jgi:hypothetical protein
MSQRDLVAELRAAHIEAPTEVRERVRLLAASAAPPPRRLTWRRALVVALPVAAAVAAAVVFTTRPSQHQAQTVLHGERASVSHGAVLAPKTFGAAAPAPSHTRVQNYDAALGVRVKSPDAVSSAVQQALRVARSFGGYESSVHVTVKRASGVADLTLKVPRAHVREAVARLSTLGTVTSEQVDIRDVTATLNATDRTIARLQHEVAALRRLPPSELTKARIAALVRQIQRLQRADAAAQRKAHFATVRLRLATPAAAVEHHRHGPLHDLVVALEWLGIGALYALVLGAPVVIVALLAWFVVRFVRRRREDALLSS